MTKGVTPVDDNTCIEIKRFLGELKMKNWEKRVEEIGNMSNRELREKTKHRTFTSMAQRRRWLALQGMLEEKKEKNGDE